MQRVPFPAGSKPFMLRVSPDGRVVWVQTETTAMNVVLDTETMETLNSAPAGKDPEQSAFQPGGPHGMIAHVASDALVVLDQATGAPVTAIDLGGSQGNICFTPDGARVFVSSPSGNEAAIVDMARLAIAGKIPTSPGPMGLVLLDPTSDSGLPAT